jgi:3-oxoacyl-[acyl-carrier protein] reductase
MDLGLAGKVALVAGASRGLGAAVADALASEGARLSLCARDRERLDATATDIARRHGTDVLRRVTDVTRETDVDAWVEEARERFGRVDILVANAGGPPASRFESTDVEAWRRGIDLNLMSTIYLARAVVPSMTAQGWGRIVAITSISVKQPVDGLILSNTARAGVAGLMKTLANELAPKGVTVNLVCPGYTRTDRLVELAKRMSAQEGVAEEAIYGRWTGQIPMGRLGEASELASVVAFLCSARASYVTGTCLAVDGGSVKGLL